MSKFVSFDAVVTYSIGPSVNRGIPIASGFQPLFCFDDIEVTAEYEYPDGVIVYPGDSVSLGVRLRVSFVGIENIYRGMSFELKETGSLKGEGTVRSVPKFV